MCTQHNGQGNGKKLFSLTSEHRIINIVAHIIQVCLMRSHIKTRAFIGPYYNPQGTLHYLSTIENFSACCNTSRGIKLAASKASRLRWACSLAISATERLKRLFFPMVTRGYSEKIRVLLCGSRTYDGLLISSSDARQLSYTL